MTRPVAYRALRLLRLIRTSKVFRYAVAVARQHGARIVLLHALEPMGQTATTLVRNVVPAKTLKKLEEEGLSRVRNEIHDRLNRFCETELGPGAREEDLVAAIHIIEGQPAKVILSEAAANNADMIVMGMHGYSGIERVLLGSVANKVAQQSLIPVLLVPVWEES